jgi:hypothetical protein
MKLGREEVPKQAENPGLENTMAYIQSCRTMFELQQKLKKEKEGDAR